MFAYFLGRGIKSDSNTERVILCAPHLILENFILTISKS